MESQQQLMEQQSAGDFNDALDAQPALTSTGACTTHPIFETNGRDILRMLVAKNKASASLSRYKWASLSDKNRINIIKTFVDLPLSEQQEMISAVEL